MCGSIILRLSLLYSLSVSIYQTVHIVLLPILSVTFFVVDIDVIAFLDHCHRVAVVFSLFLSYCSVEVFHVINFDH